MLSMDAARIYLIQKYSKNSNRVKYYYILLLLILLACMKKMQQSILSAVLYTALFHHCKSDT